MSVWGFSIVTLTVVLFFSAQVFSETLTYFQSDERYTYRIKLLKLALSYSSNTYQLQPFPKKVTQNRGLALLQHGSGVDVAFLPTSIEREERFLPVRIPILRGVLGYRIFIIKAIKQSVFSDIQSLDQLKKRQAGFGSQWADMAILQANALNVVGSPQYETLFEMLVQNRFDYFPRGINEAWHEVKARKAIYPSLAVESDLGLYYPYPVYFFVNKHRADLAQEIENGLNKALTDGQFRALFLQFHQDDIQRANLDHRRLFKLINPSVPEGTPEIDTDWWLSPKS